MQLPQSTRSTIIKASSEIIVGACQSVLHLPMIWLHIQNAQGGPPNSTRDDLIKGLAAGALGLIGTVVTILVGWLKDRDTSTTRLRQLDEASKRVAFWETWYKAIAPLDSGNDLDFWRARARTQMWFASVNH